MLQSQIIKLLSYALLLFAVIAASFIKGMNYQQDKERAIDYKSIVNSVSIIQQKNKELYDQSLIYQQKRDQLLLNNKKLETQLKDLLNKPTYTECKVDDEVFNKLNEMLK